METNWANVRCSMSGETQTWQPILEESTLPSNNINGKRTRENVAKTSFLLTAAPPFPALVRSSV
jgi:hypothetical protein